MKRITKTINVFIDIIEVYIPITVFVIMFIAFLINVFFRYVVRNPQNWTFELSVNSFVIVGLLGACAAYRREDHVVFDLLYAKLKPKGQNILRIITHIFVIIFFSISLPGSMKYLFNLPVVTSIIRIPLRIIFSSFPILMISMVLRSVYRLVLDFRVMRNKTYVQTYNIEKGDDLI